MAACIEAEALTTFEVTSDGTRVRLNARTADDAPVSFSLPSTCLNELVMTIPRIAAEALRRQHGNDKLRIVYPAGSCRIERNRDDADTYIVTLSTPDGFEVSFAFGIGKMSAMVQSIQDALSINPAASTLLN